MNTDEQVWESICEFRDQNDICEPVRWSKKLLLKILLTNLLWEKNTERKNTAYKISDMVMDFIQN